MNSISSKFQRIMIYSWLLASILLYIPISWLFYLFKWLAIEHKLLCDKLSEYIKQLIDKVE